mmetsp:Transcript_54329/g.84503  ORF Transcript_54329/g.84503 Transcript_54329/m.84503 type:complete len:114 (-) Transcript_54329:362-703(-)
MNAKAFVFFLSWPLGNTALGKCGCESSFSNVLVNVVGKLATKGTASGLCDIVDPCSARADCLGKTSPKPLFLGLAGMDDEALWLCSVVDFATCIEEEEEAPAKETGVDDFEAV